MKKQVIKGNNEFRVCCFCQSKPRFDAKTLKELAPHLTCSDPSCMNPGIYPNIDPEDTQRKTYCHKHHVKACYFYAEDKCKDEIEKIMNIKPCGILLCAKHAKKAPKCCIVVDEVKCTSRGDYLHTTCTNDPKEWFCKKHLAGY